MLQLPGAHTRVKCAVDGIHRAAGLRDCPVEFYTLVRHADETKEFGSQFKLTLKGTQLSHYCPKSLYLFTLTARLTALSPESALDDSHFSEWKYYSMPLYVESIEFTFHCTVILS